MNTIQKNTIPLTQVIINNCVPMGDIKKLTSISERNQEIANIAKGYLDLACEAFENFEKGNLKKFDALAGDTACQKRAHALSEMYEASRAQSHQRLNSLRELIFKAMHNIDKAAFSDSPLEVEALLKQLLPSSIVLTSDDQILINSYILHLTRDHHNSMKTNCANLAAKINSQFLEKIVFKLKESLVNFSVKRIQNVTSELTLLETKVHSALKNLMSDKNIISHSNLRCTPFTFNVLAILERMRQKGEVAILSLSHEPSGKITKIVLQGDPQKGFIPINAETHKDKASIVFEGISMDTSRTAEQISKDLLGDSDLIPRYPQSRFMEIILANAAKHPQYTDKSKDIPFFKKEDKAPLKEDNVPTSGVSRKALFEISQQTLDQLGDNTVLSERIKCVENQLGNNHTKEEIKKALFPGANNIEGILVLSHLYESLKQRAEKEGLCEENPKSFLVKHVYVNTVANEMKS